MKINKISMAIIAATAMLAACPAVLAQATNPPATGGGGGGNRGGGRTNQLTVESIDKAVTLTEAEKPKVKTAVDDYTKAVAAARAGDQTEMRTKMGAARTDLDKKMKDILTPEQYTKFQPMVRGGGRRGQGGGGGGGGGGAGGAGGGGGAN